LVQYLKVVDVTPPPASAPNTSYYQIGNQGTFTWTSNAGAHDNITGWRISIGTTPGSSNLANNVAVSGTSYLFTGSPGQTYYATLTAVSAAGVNSTSGSSDAGAPNPASSTTPVILLSATGDQDMDGTTNMDEAAAGTSPLDPNSRFTITSVTRTAGGVTVAFPTVPGRYYHVHSSVDLDSWGLEDESNAKNQLATASSVTFTDLNPGGMAKFYQVEVTTNPLP
jgi:hypothetical protein